MTSFRMQSFLDLYDFMWFFIIKVFFLYLLYLFGSYYLESVILNYILYFSLFSFTYKI